MISPLVFTESILPYFKMYVYFSFLMIYKIFNVCYLLSHIQQFAWTLACQAPLSMEFSRQEHWSGLPFPSPGDLPDPGIESRSPALQADSLPSEL